MWNKRNSVSVQNVGCSQSNFCAAIKGDLHLYIFPNSLHTCHCLKKKHVVERQIHIIGWDVWDFRVNINKQQYLSSPGKVTYKWFTYLVEHAFRSWVWPPGNTVTLLIKLNALHIPIHIPMCKCLVIAVSAH